VMTANRSSNAIKTINSGECRKDKDD